MNAAEIIRQYAANKAEIDRLTALNAQLADGMLCLAVFRDGSATGHLAAGGHKVSITKRINERWDQEKLHSIHKRLGDTFLGLFKQKFEPDRKALHSFFSTCKDSDIKRQIRDACTATPGKPSVKLEAVQ